MAERIQRSDGGIIVADGASASWTVEAGILHVYDVVGKAGTFGAIVAELEATASAMFAALLNATVYDDEPLVETLLALGFVVDWSEADVRAGKPVRLLGLVRHVDAM